ncbi:glycosyltransferase [Tessaracoccus sp. OS52]|uniref:glycosyltransferase n=1 Tax=Tessaracoccus sp. OS52 TaxID=2886691 RepID=UPI001D1063FE|nr:glycosyltransferase [Tessaracoccus sp. OS52]MCC2592817.1 glycosyltransferase [Tessaracoccus sp. OS52]
MRIGILIDDFFPSSGGISRSVQTQLEELTALGHEVTLIAPDRHLEKPRHCRIIECPTIYLEGLPAHLSVLHCTERRAQLIAGQAEFDIIHTQTDRGALVLGSRLARLQGVPHLHTFHANIAGTHQSVPVASVFGTLSYQVLINPFLTRASRKATPRSRLPHRNRETGGVAARMDWASFADIAAKVDGYTVPSPFMHDLITEAAGRQLRGFVVPTGVNRGMLEAIRHAKRERTDDVVRFLSVGRLAKEKRLDVLIRAFRQADLPNAELVIVGDGDQRDLLRSLARGADNIDMRGHLSSLDAIAYELVNADVLALSSYRFDSQALVIAEGVAAGLPVLLCDDRLTVGLSEETSLLTGPGAAAMAAGMRRMMDPDLRRRMSAATADLLPALAPRRTGEAYEAAYEALLAGEVGSVG